MYPHSFLWHFLWLAPHLVEAAVAVIMVRKSLHRESPWFFALVAFAAFEGLLMFTLDHMDSVSAYQWRMTYWVVSSIGIVLRFGVIYEIFARVFHRFPGLEQLSKLLYQGTLAVLLLVAVLVTVYEPGAPGPRLLAGTFIVDRAVLMIQCGLLLFLFAFSSFLGFSWRDYSFGIAAGLGISASVSLATAAVTVEWGQTIHGYLLDFADMGAYAVATTVWLLYALAPQPERELSQFVPSHNLERWNAELERVLQR